MKEEFLKWLYKKVNPYNDLTNKGLIDILFSHIDKWIINNDLEMNIGKEDLIIEFYIFNYIKNIPSTNNEYFDITFHEDIVDLFILFKEISLENGSDLYSTKGESADMLLNFLNKYIVYENECHINEENEDFIFEEEY